MSVSSANTVEMHAEIEHLQAELEQSEARFRDIIERHADAIVVVDQEGIIRFVNNEAVKLFGGTCESLLGTSFGYPLVAGETTELDLLREQQPVVAEMRVFESQWQGEAACIASLRDITERKRAEQHARDLISAEIGRAAAEQAARKFRFLAESTTALSSSLDVGETIARLAQLCITEFADWAVVYSFEGPAPHRLEVAHRDPAKTAFVRALRERPAERESHPLFALLKSPHAHVPQLLSDAEIAALLREDEHASVFLTLGTSSAMVLPMVAREHVLGAIALVCAEPARPFSAEDLALAAELASRAALALENARLYAEARRADQAKTELLALISHDLRTPLNSIIGYGQLLQMGIPEPLPEFCRERVEAILSAAKHQLYLIDELLHFARLDAGHEDVQLQDVSVQDVLHETASLLQPLAQERGLELQYRLPETPLVCHTDPDKLRQVLLNLITNAVKYTEHGAVALEAKLTDAGEVEISVSDTGVGIAPDDLTHIFEPFWQADRTQRTRGGGTGLGLALVQQIVRLLGGRISVESEPGNGSTFTVAFKSGSGGEPPEG